MDTEQDETEINQIEGGDNNMMTTIHNGTNAVLEVEGENGETYWKDTLAVSDGEITLPKSESRDSTPAREYRIEGGEVLLSIDGDWQIDVEANEPK